MKPTVRVTAALKQAQRGHLLISHQNFHPLMHIIHHLPNEGHLLCRLSSVLYGVQQLEVQANEQYYRMKKPLRWFKNHTKVNGHAKIPSCLESVSSAQKRGKAHLRIIILIPISSTDISICHFALK
jgi:hypothetical protein